MIILEKILHCGSIAGLSEKAPSGCSLSRITLTKAGEFSFSAELPSASADRM